MQFGLHFRLLVDIRQKKVYQLFRGVKPKVSWRNPFYGNLSRPRATFTLWLVCQDRLPIKDRLLRFETINDGKCVYCGLQESYMHLFFLV